MSELGRPRGAAVETCSSSVRVSALLLGGLLSSCLVTRKVDYDQPIINSTVKPVEPTTEFVALPVEPDEWCVREGFGHMRFKVEIRDLNREEDLKIRVVINKQVMDDYDVPSGGEELRTLGPPFFCVPKERLNEPCNLVEALVSSSIPSSRRDPYLTLDGDVASVHWWVIGNAEDNPNASYRDCPDPSPDAGAP